MLYFTHTSPFCFNSASDLSTPSRFTSPSSIINLILGTGLMRTRRLSICCRE